MEKIKNKNGFTLVEIIIVFAIIAMLATMLLPSLLSAPSEARDKKRVADLNRIKSVLIENTLVGVNPPNDNEILPYVDVCITPEFFSYYIPEFGGLLPTDPLGPGKHPNGPVHVVDFLCDGTYGYRPSPTPDGESESKYRFVLFAILENFDFANVKCVETDMYALPPFTDDFDEETDLPCYMLYVE